MHKLHGLAILQIDAGNQHRQAHLDAVLLQNSDFSARMDCT